jgi:hypothetical protein
MRAGAVVATSFASPQRMVRIAPDVRERGLILRPANVLQGALAQDIGIALAGFGKLDDLVRYRLLDVVVAGSDPQGDADLFECDA